MDGEGVILVQFDELMDPRPSEKTGRTYHFVSVKREGQGTGELYVTEELYKKVRSLALKAGEQFALVFKLNKFKGQFEPRLVDAVRI